MTTPARIAEIVTFRLLPGVAEADFRAAAAASMTRIAAFDGFVGRTLSVDDGGLWTDHVTWTNLDRAMAAAAEVGRDPELAPFIAAISPEGMTMTHAEIAVSG
jgi:hypothetical protein